MPKMKLMVKRTDVQIAKAKRTCKFTGSTILKGEKCLVLLEGPRDRFGYSRDTALKMISLAREHLDELEKELS